jgi:hypothetical protein
MILLLLLLFYPLYNISSFSLLNYMKLSKWLPQSLWLPFQKTLDQIPELTAVHEVSQYFTKLFQGIGTCFQTVIYDITCSYRSFNVQNKFNGSSKQESHCHYKIFTMTNYIHIFEKLTVTQLAKKFITLYGTRMFITVFTKTRYPRPFINIS